jgi:hypothetical protein
VFDIFNITSRVSRYQTTTTMLFQRPPEIEAIRMIGREDTIVKPTPKPAKIRKGLSPLETDSEEGFIIKPAAAWLQTARKSPDAQMLFDSFWFQGELCILFADTNVGKSILAVQIGDSLSRGQPIGNFRMNAPPATVLYFDFELTDKQFETRYHSPTFGHYPFNENFLRAVFNPDSTKVHKFSSFADYISNELENAILTTKATVLIIDNITYLRYGTHAAAGALSLMRSLQEIKVKYGLSVLVLAHTPKRNPVKPVNRNDLQGSKMLINFCDSAFAIGESQSVPGTRYLKQIKQRSIHEEYGAANVLFCQVVKPYNFLQFEFNGTAHETDHLMHYTEHYLKNIENRIHELHQQELTMRQIATKLNTSVSMVFRVLKRLKNDIKKE